MSFSKSFQEIMEDAKKAFEDIERTSYEKEKKDKVARSKARFINVGFVDGTKQMVVFK